MLENQLPQIIVYVLHIWQASMFDLSEGKIEVIPVLIGPPEA